mgnify:CR=1 FL=1
MNGQVSHNKYCSLVPHIVACYQKMMEEVNEMQIVLQKAVYLPSENLKNFLPHNIAAGQARIVKLDQSM